MKKKLTLYQQKRVKFCIFPGCNYSHRCNKEDFESNRTICPSCNKLTLCNGIEVIYLCNKGDE